MKIKNYALLFILSPLIANAQNTPKVITEKMLEEYVTQINASSPISGPDGIQIVGASRQERTVIYRIKTGFPTTKEAAAFLNNSESSKRGLCRQAAEGFLLSRGVSLAWNYFDSKGNFVGTISVSPKDCSMR
jgi:hypothetical protein